MSSEVDKRQFAESMERTRAEVDLRLGALLSEDTAAPSVIHEALHHVVLGGGKRLRPMLCLWTHDAVDGHARDACLDVACALELMHTYSLVHDDLPCMDDDDMRRGRPSCHKQFGEGTAVLVGDALLTMCFEILSNLGEQWQLDSGRIVQTVRIVGRAGGLQGLIAGQALDLESSATERTVAAVEKIHRYKTAALIAASMECGAVMATAGSDVVDRIHAAGELAGRAFQIIDDVLDVESNAETLGKTPGKDAEGGKLTYPAVAGRDVSRQRAGVLIAEAVEMLDGASADPMLRMLLDYLVLRTR